MPAQKATKKEVADWIASIYIDPKRVFPPSLKTRLEQVATQIGTKIGKTETATRSNIERKLTGFKNDTDVTGVDKRLVTLKSKTTVSDPALRAENARLTTEVTRLTSEETRLNGELATANSEVARLNGELGTTQAEVTRLTGEETRLNGENATLTTQRDTAVAELATRTTERDATVTERDALQKAVTISDKAVWSLFIPAIAVIGFLFVLLFAKQLVFLIGAMVSTTAFVIVLAAIFWGKRS